MTYRDNTEPMRGLVPRHWAIFVILLVAALCGLRISSDYGISWDEPQQRQTGYVSYYYIFGNDDLHLMNYFDKDYGVVVELPLVLIEKLLHIKNKQEVYHVRHLVLHLYFLSGIASLYLLVFYCFRSRALGVFAALALLLHPRLYAHSFFNSKDIPFLVTFIHAFLCLHFALRSRHPAYWVMLGVITGLLIGQRLMGMMFPVLLLPIFGVRLATPGKRQQWLINGAAYTITSLITLYASWPFLWHAPVHHFIEAFRNMSRFRWDRTVLFNGNLIPATDLPWYYAPVWILITTPVPILALGVIGLCLGLFHYLKSGVDSLRNNATAEILVYIGVFCGTFTAIWWFHSVLYDGWRQIYYVYAPFLLLGIFTLACIRDRIKQSRFNIALSLLSVSVFTPNLVWMYRNHPFEQTYFNFLIPSTENFRLTHWEMDYWGVGYKQALEYILAHDHRDSMIRVLVDDDPGVFNYRFMLNNKQKARLKVILPFAGPADFDYYISNYRWHPQPYQLPDKPYPLPDSKPFYSIMVDNNPVYTIWRRTR